jgi:hypothetical protein
MSLFSVSLNPVNNEASQYVTVAASQTTANIGLKSTGSPGDYLESLIVIPASSVAGAVTLLDGTTAILSIPVNAGGAGVPPPYTVKIGARAQARWVITTGAAVSVMAVGSFK